MPDANDTMEHDRRQKLGARLAQRRRELGISGAELARQVAIGERRYNTYEQGDRKPDIFILQRISAVSRRLSTSSSARNHTGRRETQKHPPP